VSRPGTYQPTPELRYVVQKAPIDMLGHVDALGTVGIITVNTVTARKLQQLWRNCLGREEWRDVPEVEIDAEPGRPFRERKIP
jgi:hypothetical protein